jgi:hypothetical protein
MDIPSKYKEIDVFKEGTLLGLFFILVGILLLIINAFSPNNWLIVFGIIFLALGIVFFFMSVFIPFISKRQGSVLLFAWNYFLYLFLGLPLAALCILILPVSIYILFFSGDIVIVTMFCLYFVLSLQLSSLLYTIVTIWMHRRSSGYPVPIKVDKGPIEQLLYRVPLSED